MNELVHPFDATLRDGRAVQLRAMHPAKGIAGLATLLLGDAARRQPRRRSQPASSGP